MPTVYNKVSFNDSVLMDISSDTVVPEALRVGYTAHAGNGMAIVGTYEGAEPSLQSKTATPSESVQTISPDLGYDGLSSVEVGAISSNYIGSGVRRISSNSGISINGATVTVTGQAYYTGNVSKTIPLQAKTITPSESTQTATPDSGYSGLSSVEVGAISGTYVGSEVARPSALTVNGKTITASAGYYANDVSASVSDSYIIPSGTITISSNGTIDVTDKAEAVVSVTPALQQKSATPTETAQTISPDSGYDGLSSVSVGAISSTYIGSDITRRDSTDLTASAQTVTVPAGYYEETATKSVATATKATPSITVSNSGLITASYTQSAGYVTAGTVDNTEQLTTKASATYTPSESIQTIAAGQYLTGAQTIGAISSTYVGSGIAHNDSSDLSANGATVTVPAGYYEDDASASVASGSASTPATTITVTPSITVSNSGLITASASGSRNITPSVEAGYVSSGTAGTVSVSGSDTLQLTTRSAQTLYPSTSDQTIASGAYLTGTQTIKAVRVSGLSAGSILSGTTVTVGDATDADRITSVTGTLEVVNYHTGSGVPASSLGSNGDIYIRVVS